MDVNINPSAIVLVVRGKEPWDSAFSDMFSVCPDENQVLNVRVQDGITVLKCKTLGNQVFSA